MAEKYKVKKVSDLPEPSSLDGFYAFGTDQDNNSVKVPIEQLKGNSPHIGANGNWWVGTVDTGVKAQGAPGEVSKEDLSEYAKTETEEGIVVRSEDGKIKDIYLRDKLYGHTTENLLAKPGNSGGNFGSAPWYYNDQSAIQGNRIIGIGIAAIRTGVVSIVKAKRIKTDKYTYSKVSEIRVTSLGVNVFDVNIELATDEYLGIGLPNETFVLGTRANVNDATAGGYCAKPSTGGAWHIDERFDMGVSIYYYSEGGDIQRLNEKQKVSDLEIQILEEKIDNLIIQDGAPATQLRISKKIGTIAFIFDDSIVADRQWLIDEFENRGMKFSVALSPHPSVDPNIDLNKYKKLQNKGHAMLSHSYRHDSYTGLTDQQIRDYTLESLDWLYSADLRIDGFVYPNNASDDRVANILNRYYTFAFSGQSKIYNDKDDKMMILSRFGEIERMDLQTIKDAIDGVIDNNKLLVIWGHPFRIGASGYLLTKENMIEVIEYIKSKINSYDVQLLNIYDAINYYYGSVN